MSNNDKTSTTLSLSAFLEAQSKGLPEMEHRKIVIKPDTAPLKKRETNMMRPRGNRRNFREGR